MNRTTEAVFMAAFGMVTAGCAAPPPAELPSAAPIISPAPPQSSPAQIAEAMYRERAEAFERKGHWADALMQRELLALLRPDSREYRDQAGRTRRRISETAGVLLQEAEQARRRGNLGEATMQYLRVLSLDRTNARAAEGLREIERERTRRAYLNRPPRVSIQ